MFDKSLAPFMAGPLHTNLVITIKLILNRFLVTTIHHIFVHPLLESGRHIFQNGTPHHRLTKKTKDQPQVDLIVIFVEISSLEFPKI